VKLCLVSGLPDIIKDYRTMRNLREIFLRSFENVGPDVEWCLWPGKVDGGSSMEILVTQHDILQCFETVMMKGDEARFRLYEVTHIHPSVITHW